MRPSAAGLALGLLVGLLAMQSPIAADDAREVARAVVAIGILLVAAPPVRIAARRTATDRAVPLRPQ